MAPLGAVPIDFLFVFSGESKLLIIDGNHIDREMERNEDTDWEKRKKKGK